MLWKKVLKLTAYYEMLQCVFRTQGPQENDMNWTEALINSSK